MRNVNKFEVSFHRYYSAIASTCFSVTANATLRMLSPFRGKCIVLMPTFVIDIGDGAKNTKIECARFADICRMPGRYIVY